MSHRPPQQTKEDERAELLVQLEALAAEYREMYGRLPPAIGGMKRYENSDRIDFGEVSNDDLQYLCERIRAGI